MTEEQSGKLVDVVDFLISEIRRLRIDIAEGHAPSLAERIETYARKRREPTEPVVTYISRYTGNPYGEQFVGGAAIAEYAMRMEELLIELMADPPDDLRFAIKSRMGWK